MPILANSERSNRLQLTPLPNCPKVDSKVGGPVCDGGVINALLRTCKDAAGREHRAKAKGHEGDVHALLNIHQ